MVQRRERLVSLDIFRGVTIAGMILVNNPGSWSHVYPPLLHAEWHGWTPTDLIFPFFLFIVGVAMTYSFGKMFERGIPKSKIYSKVFKRSAILFGIGLFMAIFPVVRFDPLRLYDFSSMRIMGVLQRIALCYLFASVIYLEFRKLRSLVIWIVGLLGGYWLLMTTVPVPGYGAGDLSRAGNLAAYVDQLVMAEHLWKPGWDPEGLLSTIPAIGTVLLGLLTGKLLRSPKSDKEKVIQMFLYGNAGLVSGLIIDTWFPINKGLWTSSYVLFTGGFALHFLAICYWFVDIKRYRNWTKPFEVYGLNALAVFVLSTLTAKLMYVIPVYTEGGQTTIKGLIYDNLLLPIASPMNASLIFALLYILFWLWVMWIFYKRKIFVKI
jgi:predicted acyltransferase